MVTSADRNVIQSLLSAARAESTGPIRGESGQRTKGFVVAIYDEYFPKYGNDWFPAGKLKRKIKDRYVRGVFDTGKELKNRNFDDREVVGARLLPLGYLELKPSPDYLVRWTEAGNRKALELIASIEAE